MMNPSKKPDFITRRAAIARVTTILGGVPLVGATAFVAGCAREEPANTSIFPLADAPFTGADIAWLDEVAETILPETATPGAKAAGVGPFIALMVTDTYRAEERQIFREGMTRLDEESEAAFGTTFLDATRADRIALLERLDREQYDAMNARAPGDPVHYFRMMKELALLGYFTSEIGYTQAMRYVESPGRFDPSVEYRPGDRAWAPHA